MRLMLTAKQEAFAQAIADGRSQADAYWLAYDVGPRTKPETVYKRASELMADGQVAERVEALRSELAMEALWTRRQSVEALAAIARRESPDAKPADQIAAVRALNVMHGYDAPERVVLTARLEPIRDEDWL